MRALLLKSIHGVTLESNHESHFQRCYECPSSCAALADSYVLSSVKVATGG